MLPVALIELLERPAYCARVKLPGDYVGKERNRQCINFNALEKIMFKRNMLSTLQFPTSEPNDFGFGNVGVTTERQTFGSVGLTSSVATPDEAEHTPTWVTKLLAAPPSDVKNELVSDFFSLKAQIDEWLEETRTERLAILTVQHTAAVLAARAAGKVAEQAEEASWEAHSLFTPLDEKEKAKRATLAGAQHKLANCNRALTTAKERNAMQIVIDKCKIDLQVAAETAGVALLKHQSLIAKAGESKRLAMQAVNEAESIHAQIDAL
jgi:hypothetical protein